jgi:hypothetical protein
MPQRQAVLMRDVQGLSYDEIAAVQDVPVGTVRSRIAAARRSIRRGGRGVSEHLTDVQLSRLIDGDLSLTSREAVTAHCAVSGLRGAPRPDHRVAATLRSKPATPGRAP